MSDSLSADMFAVAVKLSVLNPYPPCLPSQSKQALAQAHLELDAAQHHPGQPRGRLRDDEEARMGPGGAHALGQRRRDSALGTEHDWDEEDDDDAAWDEDSQEGAKKAMCPCTHIIHSWSSHNSVP